MFRQSKKIILSFMSVMLVVFCVNMFSFESNAANVYYSNFEEPTTNEYCGYINLEIDFDNDATKCITLAWSIIPTEVVDNSTVAPTTMMNIQVNERNVELTAVNNGLADCHLLVWELNAAAEKSLIVKNAFPSAGYMTVSDAWNGDIIGFSVYGNYGSVTSYMGSYNASCTVVWADEQLPLNKLTEIYSMVSTLNSNLGGKLDTLISKMTTLISEMDSVEETLASIESMVSDYMPMIYAELEGANENLVLIANKLDSLIAEQQESNSWLEKIFNYLDQSEEQKKETATDQGNTSVSEGNSAIADNSGGFIDSLGSLVNSMSYEGTTAKWNFPQIKLPAIPGVMDEVVLVESQTIDFGWWVNMTPSRVRQTVRAICTIALIVYCFKELYGTISYVLTLRGGGNNE